MKYLSLLAIMFALTGCPETTDPPPERPPGVEIIPSNGGTALTEQGLRAKPGIKNSIIIEWVPVSASVLLDRYDIYRSISPDSTFRRVLSVGGSGLPVAQDDTVGVDTTYYYYVVAVNSRQVESDVSAYFETPDSIAKYVQSFTLGAKPASLLHPTPSDTVVTTKPMFEWCPGAIPLQYVLRLGVGSITSPATIWISETPSVVFNIDCNDENEREFLTYHDSTYFASHAPGDSLYARANEVIISRSSNILKSARLSKTTYYWRVDAIYGTHHASASGWVPFLVNRDY